MSYLQVRTLPPEQKQIKQKYIMKITKLEIVNIGILKDVNETIDKPMILFYGDIKQGKTTILNAIKWCFGGAFPDDIIRHGEEEAWIHIHFPNGSIRREFYINKNGETVARSIQFIKDGSVVKSPVNEIKRLLNPFLLDQDHLKNMNETERNKFFVDLFGVDTSEEDQQITEAKKKAQELRIEIKAYGEIDTTEVECVDVDAKKMKLEGINHNYEAECKTVENLNKEPIAHNQTVDQKEVRKSELEKELADINTWLKSNPRKEITPTPQKPDTSQLEEEISNAKAQNVRYETYTANLEKKKEKDEKKEQLDKLEELQRKLTREKTAKLFEVSKTIGIKNLLFDENANLIYENTTMGMLSTSQVMQLSSELSKLYPEGFGFELIDRGESLGKSIFTFVNKAKAENKTILATIVGEKPADVPEEIGVFVVEQGQLVK